MSPEVLEPVREQPRSPGEPVTTEVLFREARRRRHRRWLLSGLAVGVLTVGVVAWAAEGSGGSRPPISPKAGDGRLPGAPPVGGAPRAQPGLGSAAVATLPGQGPTSVDFESAQRGFVATGCSGFCVLSRPVIISTLDGGQSWRQLRSPDVGSVSFSEFTWHKLGGTVAVRFVGANRGWYLQVGELWETSDAGASWRQDDLHGQVVDLATTSTAALALVSHCPRFPLSCAQLDLYRWTQGAPTWTRAATFSSGKADPGTASLVMAGDFVFARAGGRQYRIDQSGAVHRVGTRCWAIAGLPGQLVGICPTPGGDGASATVFAVSTDGGAHWRMGVSGPPAEGWSGTVATNGRGVVWYVVNGTTLWRASTSGGPWSAVYHAQPGTTDELYPVVPASGRVGFMGETGSGGIRFLRTVDGGRSWLRISSPPYGSR